MATPCLRSASSVPNAAYLGVSLKSNMIIKFLKMLLIVFAFASPALASGEVGALHLNPLHIELPATWVIDGSRSPIEGRGPNGEKMLITVMRLQDGAVSKSADEIARGFANAEMKRLGSEDGQIVIREVSPLPVSEGKAGYSMASQSSSFFGGKTYFIQYLLASSRAVIFFTIEGRGEAEPMMLEFDKYLESQRWDAEG